MADIGLLAGRTAEPVLADPALPDTAFIELAQDGFFGTGRDDDDELDNVDAGFVTVAVVEGPRLAVAQTGRFGTAGPTAPAFADGNPFKSLLISSFIFRG